MAVNSAQTGDRELLRKTAFRVRAELARREWTRQHLAAVLNRSPGTISNVICGNSCSAKVRRELEVLLGVNFWTGGSAMEERAS